MDTDTQGTELMPDMPPQEFRWVGTADRLPTTGRVLAFSPCYEEGEAMRYRLMDAAIVRFSEEITHWVYIDLLEPEELK